MPSERPGPQPPAYPKSLVVYAQLHGRRTLLLRLVVDSGATYTMIPVRAAMAIGCDPAVTTQRIPLVTVSAVEYAPLVTVPSLTCLGHQFRNISVVCHDLPPQSAVDGLLGLNVLTHIPSFRAFLRSIHSHLL